MALMHNVQAKHFYHQLPKHFILSFYVENWTGILLIFRTIILVQRLLNVTNLNFLHSVWFYNDLLLHFEWHCHTGSSRLSVK